MLSNVLDIWGKWFLRILGFIAFEEKSLELPYLS
jgi:hypothetical protein